MKMTPKRLSILCTVFWATLIFFSTFARAKEVDAIPVTPEEQARYLDEALRTGVITINSGCFHLSEDPAKGPVQHENLKTFIKFLQERVQPQVRAGNLRVNLILNGDFMDGPLGPKDYDRRILDSVNLVAGLRNAVTGEDQFSVVRAGRTYTGNRVESLDQLARAQVRQNPNVLTLSSVGNHDNAVLPRFNAESNIFNAVTKANREHPGISLDEMMKLPAVREVFATQTGRAYDPSKIAAKTSYENVVADWARRLQNKENPNDFRPVTDEFVDARNTERMFQALSRVSEVASNRPGTPRIIRLLGENGKKGEIIVWQHYPFQSGGERVRDEVISDFNRRKIARQPAEMPLITVEQILAAVPDFNPKDSGERVVLLGGDIHSEQHILTKLLTSVNNVLHAIPGVFANVIYAVNNRLGPDAGEDAPGFSITNPRFLGQFRLSVGAADGVDARGNVKYKSAPLALELRNDDPARPPATPRMASTDAERQRTTTRLLNAGDSYPLEQPHAVEARAFDLDDTLLRTTTPTVLQRKEPGLTKKDLPRVRRELVDALVREAKASGMNPRELSEYQRKLIERAKDNVYLTPDGRIRFNATSAEFARFHSATSHGDVNSHWNNGWETFDTKVIVKLPDGSVENISTVEFKKFFNIHTKERLEKPPAGASAEQMARFTHLAGARATDVKPGTMEHNSDLKYLFDPETPDRFYDDLLEGLVRGVKESDHPNAAEIAQGIRKGKLSDDLKKEFLRGLLGNKFSFPPGMARYIEALNDPNLARWTSIITARKHFSDYFGATRGFAKFADTLKQLGAIKYLPQPNRFRAIGNEIDPNGFDEMQSMKTNPAPTKGKVALRDVAELAALHRRQEDLHGFGRVPPVKYSFEDDSAGNVTQVLRDVYSGLRNNPDFKNVELEVHYDGPATEPGREIEIETPNGKVKLSFPDSTKRASTVVADSTASELSAFGSDGLRRSRRRSPARGPGDDWRSKPAAHQSGT